MIEEVIKRFRDFVIKTRNISKARMKVVVLNEGEVPLSIYDLSGKHYISMGNTVFDDSILDFGESVDFPGDLTEVNCAVSVLIWKENEYIYAQTKGFALFWYRGRLVFYIRERGMSRHWGIRPYLRRHMDGSLSPLLIVEDEVIEDSSKCRFNDIIPKKWYRGISFGDIGRKMAVIPVYKKNERFEQRIFRHKYVMFTYENSSGQIMLSSDYLKYCNLNLIAPETSVTTFDTVASLSLINSESFISDDIIFSSGCNSIWTSENIFIQRNVGGDFQRYVLVTDTGEPAMAVYRNNYMYMLYNGSTELKSASMDRLAVMRCLV